MTLLNTIGPSPSPKIRSSRSSFPVQMRARFPVVRPDGPTASDGALSSSTLPAIRLAQPELGVGNDEAPASRTRELFNRLVTVRGSWSNLDRRNGGIGLPT